MSPFRHKKDGREPADANLARDLVQRLGGGGERTAISFIDELGVIERVSFAEVARRASRWAALLRDNAVGAGDRVLVLAGRDLVWRPALLGAVELGAIAVPCPASTPVEGILERARHCGAKLIVSAVARPDLDAQLSPPVLAAAEELARPPAPSPTMPPAATAARDVALVLYVEDAGGVRGVTHTHGSLLAQALAGEHWLGSGPGARVWGSATDGSAASLWTTLAAWAAGAELVVVWREPDAEARLEFLQSLAIDALWLSPGEYRALAQSEHPGWYDLSSIRRALSSPALDVETGGRLREAFGLSVGAVHGLPEAGIVAATGNGESVTGTKVGRPLPGLELAIVDADGRPLPAGEEGELVVQGAAASLFSGYWNAPRATAAALRKGTFWTGIGGAFAGSGSLHVTGRSSRSIAPVEEPLPPPELLLEAAAAPASAPAPRPEKLTRDERRRQREAEALRLVAERARLERDEIERLRVEREERLVEEQRQLEARRLREQEKARKRTGDRGAQPRVEEGESRRDVRKAEREQQKAEAKRRKQESQLAAEQRRRAEEEERRERDRQRREEKDAVHAAKAAGAIAVAEEHRRREEETRAEQERAAAAAAERRREEEEAKRAASAEEERQVREAAAAAAAAEQTRRRHEQEAAAAAEQARQAEEVRLAAERVEAEKQRRAEEATRLEHERREREEAERREREAAERQQRQEREREEALAAEQARLEHERAEAEERRLAEEATRREAEALLREAEQRRRREEAERAQHAVEEATRKQQEAQAAALREEEQRRRRLAAQRQRPKPGEQPVESADPNPSLLARIGQYGMSGGGPAPGSPDPDSRGKDDGPSRDRRSS